MENDSFIDDDDDDDFSPTQDRKRGLHKCYSGSSSGSGENNVEKKKKGEDRNPEQGR